MVSIRMPTRAQLRWSYKGIVTWRAQSGNLPKLNSKPAGVAKMSKFGNIGIANVPGRENVYSTGTQLFLENKNKGVTTWYNAGPAPQFRGR